MTGRGRTAARKISFLFFIAFPVALHAAGETIEPAETATKDDREASRKSAAGDPLLIDATSPRHRRLGAALSREAIPHPWVLVPHKYEIWGREYRLHLLGYVKLDVMHDFDSLGQTSGFPNFFIPSEIPLQNPALLDRDNRTGVTINSSRLEFGIGTDTPLGQASALLDFNFLQNPTGRPVLNIRQLFFELDPLRVGKSWTTFINLQSIPDTLDYQGPNSLPEARSPLVRWTQPLAIGPLANTKALQNLSLALAAEWPDGELYLPQGMRTRNPLPDFVASLQYEKHHSSVWLSGLYRRLEAEGNGVRTATNSWGIQLGGNIPVRKAASVQFGAIYGAGLGHYLNDTQGLDLDGALDSAGRLRAIPAVATWLGGQYWWRVDLRSTVSYGYVYLWDKFVIAFPDDSEGIYRQGHYASANLIWSPISPVDVGVEYLFGYRQNNDSRSGIANRIQFSFILHFSSGASARGAASLWERLLNDAPDPASP